MQAYAFAVLAPPVSGIIAIRYRQVACTPPGGIRIVVTAFNGPGLYLRFTFQVTASGAEPMSRTWSMAAWLFAVKDLVSTPQLTNGNLMLPTVPV